MNKIPSEEEVSSLIGKYAAHHEVTTYDDIPCSLRPCSKCRIMQECYEKKWNWADDAWEPIFKKNYPEYSV